MFASDPLSCRSIPHRRLHKISHPPASSCALLVPGPFLLCNQTLQIHVYLLHVHGIEVRGEVASPHSETVFCKGSSKGRCLYICGCVVLTSDDSDRQFERHKRYNSSLW